MTPVLSSRTHVITLATLAALATMSIASSAQAAIYVHFDGIDGSSVDSTHANWCDVQSFSREASAAAGGAVRRAAAQFSAITIVREIDKASPKLEEALVRGAVIPTVTIEATAAFGSGIRQVYYRLQLTNVRITRFAQSASVASEAPIVEEVALSFETARVTFVDFDSRGRSRGNVEYSWTVPGVNP